MEKMLDEVGKILKQADCVLFVTGAGISAESGLPTYRGIGGLYEGKETDEGVPIDVALSKTMFRENPEITWKHLWEIGKACIGAQPNRAHLAIAEIEAAKSNVWTMTQNVDDLHRSAGSRNLIEVHGHMYDLYCIECGKTFNAHDYLDEFAERIELPPKCDQCGGTVRPDVVLFEEFLPESVIQAFEKLASTEFELVISIGTSALFPYIAEPIRVANAWNVPTVEINPVETAISADVRFPIRLPAGEALEHLINAN